MVVLRPNAESSTGLVNCVSGLGLVCLVVALLGIKLKWFKHRLTFNGTNNEDASEIASTSRGFYSANGNGGEGGGGVHRSISVSSEPQIIRATFRSFDECFDITPTVVLPPIRITNNRPPLRPRSRAPPPPTASELDVVNEEAIIIQKKISLDMNPLIFSEDSKEALLNQHNSSLNAEETVLISKTNGFTKVNNEENYIILKSEPEDTRNSKEKHSITNLDNVDDNHSTTIKTQPIESNSSSQVGSVSIDILPSNKQTILFTSTENIHETFTYAIDPIDAGQDHLEIPVSPKPPNSPPPRPSQLENYLKFAKLNVEKDESDELPPISSIITVPLKVPTSQPPAHLPPPPPYSELDKASSQSSTPKSMKAKRHVRIITPEVSERSDSDDSDNTYSFEAARTRSTPDLTLPPPNAIRPYLQLTPGPTIDSAYLTQSTPNLAATSKPVISNPIASFFSFLSWRATPQENKSEALTKKKTKTIRVLKEPKEVKVPKLLLNPLNPLVQQQTLAESSSTPKPVQRKKKQLKLEAQISQLDSSEFIPSSPLKEVRFAATNEPPVPKQRTILNVNAHNIDGNLPISVAPSEPPNGFEMFIGNDNQQRLNAAEKSNDDSSDEDAWNLVAQHRRNHAELVAKQATVLKKMESEQTAINNAVDTTSAAARPLELFNRPKTLREMQQEKRELAERRQAARGAEDESDTEA